MRSEKVDWDYLFPVVPNAHPQIPILGAEDFGFGDWVGIIGIPAGFTGLGLDEKAAANEEADLLLP